VTVQSLAETRDQDPYEFFGRKLSEGPVHWDERMNAWLVVGYEETRYVQLHEDKFNHPYFKLQGAADVYGGARAVLLLQGDEHHAVHHFLLRQFTPSTTRTYREKFIAELVGRRLDAMGDRNRIDLATEYATMIPSDVIAAMLGLDWRDRELMEKCRLWNIATFRWTETFGDDDSAYAEANAAAQALNEILLPVVRARREHPRDDLISVMWTKGEGVLDHWDEEEVLAQCRVLFFAGTDTTSHFLKNSIFALVEQPEYQDLLRGDEARIEAFGEELLRYLAPVQFRIRVAAEDVELGGVLIKAGDRVHPVNAAANRDPEHYENPGTVDLNRPSPKDHLAFNVGPRYCVGAALARAEEVEVIKHLLDRYRNIRWNENAEPPRFRGFMPRSFSPLNVVVEQNR
jgi:cytochrome P450